MIGEEVFENQEDGSTKKVPYEKPVIMGAMELENLKKQASKDIDYQKYIDSQMEKIGETNDEVRRYINRCKKDGEKRKCLVNPEGLL